MSNNKRIRATVKWFDCQRGIGFLEAQNEDVFVHYRSIEPDTTGYKNLKREVVEYVQTQTDKGLAAAEVYRLH